MQAVNTCRCTWLTCENRREQSGNERLTLKTMGGGIASPWEAAFATTVRHVLLDAAITGTFGAARRSRGDMAEGRAWFRRFVLWIPGYPPLAVATCGTLVIVCDTSELVWVSVWCLFLTQSGVKQADGPSKMQVRIQAENAYKQVVLLVATHVVWNLTICTEMPSWYEWRRCVVIIKSYEWRYLVRSYVYVIKNIFWLTLAIDIIPSKVYYDYSHYYEEKPLYFPRVSMKNFWPWHFRRSDRKSKNNLTTNKVLIKTFSK